MSTIVSLIREYQALQLPAGAAADLFERALQSVLEAEGPPAEPIGGISSPVVSAIARSPKGRALFLCHSWETAGWVCLLLDLPPVVMGRPVFLKNPAGGPGRVVTDYQSQKFQRRIVAACLALGLSAPPEPSKLSCLLDAGRLFVAWKPLGRSAPVLVGDLDNYAKNIMDGLQRARIVPNDRTIAAISFARSSLPTAAESLEEVLIRQLLAVKADHPKLNQRALAKQAGVSQRQCRHLLALAQARQSLQPGGGTPGGTPASQGIDFKASVLPPPAVLTHTEPTSPVLAPLPGTVDSAGALTEGDFASQVAPAASSPSSTPAAPDLAPASSIAGSAATPAAPVPADPAAAPAGRPASIHPSRLSPSERRKRDQFNRRRSRRNPRR